MSGARDLRVVRLDQVAPQRWRNGGGFTRELLAWPSADDWQLRLSVADIESDGPFSTFAGVQRWFCVLQGDAVRLAVDGQPHVLRPGDPPLAFRGEALTEAWLTGGATRDLNLMLRGRRGALLPASPGTPWQPPGAPWGLFTMGSGRVSFDGDRRVEQLPAAALLACIEPAAGPVCFDPADAPLAAWWWWSAAHDSLDASPPAPTRSPP